MSAVFQYQPETFKSIDVIKNICNYVRINTSQMSAVFHYQPETFKSIDVIKNIHSYTYTCFESKITFL